MMENHLYECMYDILKLPELSDKTLPMLNRLKAKIVRLHRVSPQKILEDNSVADRPDGEQPTICHILQTKWRLSERIIRDRAKKFENSSG